MVTYYRESIWPGGGPIVWTASAGQATPVLQVDVPNGEGVWPAGKVQRIIEEDKEGLHLQILPCGGNAKRHVVVVFLVGYAFRVIEEAMEIAGTRFSEASILAQCQSWTNRETGILVAAEIPQAAALVIQEIPRYGHEEPHYWVFGQLKAAKLSKEVHKPRLEYIEEL